MPTICVGCGLDISVDGKVQIDRGATEMHLQASFINQVGSGVMPATFDTALAPTLCIPAVNPSDCRDMVLVADIEGNAKLAWAVGTEMLVVFPEFSIDGGVTWTEGAQVGISGPATTWTEGRFVALTFHRQVTTLAPGASASICMRYRTRCSNSVTASVGDLDMVFTLDGFYIN